jgi:hypothetical protein
MMKRLILVSGLALSACGGDTPGTAGQSTPPGDEGYIRFELSGGGLAVPVTFEGRSERLAAMLATDQPSVAFRQDPITSTAGEFVFKQLTMNLPSKELTTHASGSFETRFTVEGPMNADGSRTTFSIRASGENSGSITISEVGDRLRGSVDVIGSPTQVNGRGQVFRIEGVFDFVRCPSLVCF